MKGIKIMKPKNFKPFIYFMVKTAKIEKCTKLIGHDYHDFLIRGISVNHGNHGSKHNCELSPFTILVLAK